MLKEYIKYNYIKCSLETREWIKEEKNAMNRTYLRIWQC